MKKKLLSILLVGILIISLTGCNGTKEEENYDSSNTKQEETTVKGNCDVFECMGKLASNMTVEEMNKVIGFDGELVSEEENYKIYSWKLNENTSISSQFMLKYDTAIISANYPSSMVSKKADFSKWDEIESKLKNNEAITYKEFVKLVGNIEGTMKQKTSSKVTYEWYNSDGGYLLGYFDNDGNCTMATGRF